MINTIGEKLNEIASPFVPLYFAEAETESYPYAVYSMTAETARTKDGPYKIAAQVELNIYAPDYATAANIAEQLRGGIAQGMHSAQYSARLQEEQNDCLEGVWVFQMTYTINQYF